jgi:hypothetical protein
MMFGWEIVPRVPPFKPRAVSRSRLGATIMDTATVLSRREAMLRSWTTVPGGIALVQALGLPSSS